MALIRIQGGPGESLPRAAVHPALLFFVSIAGEYPGILTASVPVNHMLQAPGSRTILVVFQVMLFGTLVETGAGLIHSVNERIARTCSERHRELSVGIRMGVRW